MAEQSPYELFSSSPKKDGNKKEKKQPVVQRKDDRKFGYQPVSGKASEQLDQAIETINKLKEKQKKVEAALIAHWVGKGRSLESYYQYKNKSLDQLPIEVKKKLERLAAEIAFATGEKVLPEKYRHIETKNISEKERKGKVLGARKKWMPMR